MEIVKRAKIKQGITYSDPKSVGGSNGLLANLIPFDSQGAMKARRFPGLPYGKPKVAHGFDGPWGKLERNRLYMDPLYVVWSYFTPIAFVGYDGALYIPDEKYSVTTTHHQNLCHEWLGRGRVWSDQDQTHISWTTQAVRDAQKGVWV